MKRTRLASALLVAALAGSAAGCLNTTTRVEQGEVPTTGNNDFDGFFKEVVELREQTSKAESEELAARERLSRALGLDAKADQDATVDAAQERAKQLRDNGIQLHLELTPEPKVVKVEGTIPLDGDGQAILKAVEESAKSSLELSRKLGALPDRVDKLEKRRAELLAETQSAFKKEKPAKRREIERELEGAGEVLTEASRTSIKFAGLASKFVLELARAVETGGATAALAQATKTQAPAAPTKPVPRWKSPPRPAGVPAQPPPTRPASATPPPPKPKPPAGDDFDP